jgi:hypothetical protein
MINSLIKLKIFEVSQDIFLPGIPSSDPKAFTLTRGAHSFPFQIQFPKLSSCRGAGSDIPHLERSLPPSFTFDAPSHCGSAKVQYWLRVQVKRPGRFKINQSLKQQIVLLLLDPTPPLWMLDPSYSNPTQLFNMDINVLSSTFRNASRIRLRTDLSVIVEAILPSPAILYMKGGIPLRLFIKTAATQTGVLDHCQVLFENLTISISTSTTITLRSDRATWTSSKDLVTLSGLRQPLHASSLEFPEEVSNDLWKYTTISDVTPSFTTCTMAQRHSLVIKAGFSHSLEDKIYVSDCLFQY